MYTCANCTVHACRDAEHKDMPKNCPMRQEEMLKEVKEEFLRAGA